MTFALAQAAPGQVQSLAWPTDAFRIFHVSFDKEGFAPARFAQAGIDLPQRIAGAVAKRQAEYFYGRLCSQAALASAHLHGVQVGTGPLREPLWPPGFTGSITHDGSIAAAVVLPAARWAGIGIDVETVGQGSAIDALRQTVVSARELDYLSACAAGMSMDALLTLVFSAKESFYKGVSSLVGRVLEFDVIELRRIDAPGGTLEFEVCQALAGPFQPGYRVRVDFCADAGRVLTCFQRLAKSSC